MGSLKPDKLKKPAPPPPLPDDTAAREAAEAALMERRRKRRGRFGTILTSGQGAGAGDLTILGKQLLGS